MTAGALSIGDNFKLFCLGDDFYILSTRSEITTEFLQQISDDNNQLIIPKDATLWIIHANTDNLGEFTPLDQSVELKQLIKRIVNHSIAIKNNG